MVGLIRSEPLITPSNLKNRIMKAMCFTIGHDKNVTFATAQEAIKAMNENPSQSLEDIFGYDENGEEYLEGEVEEINGKFELIEVSYI